MDTTTSSRPKVKPGELALQQSGNGRIVQIRADWIIPGSFDVSGSDGISHHCTALQTWEEATKRANHFMHTGEWLK